MSRTIFKKGSIRCLFLEGDLRPRIPLNDDCNKLLFRVLRRVAGINGPPWKGPEQLTRHHGPSLDRSCFSSVQGWKLFPAAGTGHSPGRRVRQLSPDLAQPLTLKEVTDVSLVPSGQPLLGQREPFSERVATARAGARSLAERGRWPPPAPV